MVEKVTDGLFAITASLMELEEEKSELTALREEYLSVTAKIGVFGTRAVRDLFAEWARGRQGVISSHIALREAMKDDPDDRHDDLWEKRKAARRELQAAVSALREQMNQELAS